MTAPVNYRVATLSPTDHAVFVVHQETPDAWRLIARFIDRDRADSFADVENCCLEDEPLWEADVQPCLNAPAAPPSKLSRLNAEQRDLPTPSRTPPETLDNTEQQDEPDDDTEQKEPPEKTDLKPLTPKQAAALFGLKEALKKDKRPSLSNIRKHAGIGAASIQTNLEMLADKGYIENRGERGAPDWHVLFQGDPVIEENGNAPTRWTDEEDDALRKLFSQQTVTRADVELFAKSISRTPGACIQHARSLRLSVDNYNQASPSPPASRVKTAPVRRFTDVKALNPEAVSGLDDSHPAIVEKRTLFPGTVIDPSDSPKLLVSGAHSRKLGDRVIKGPWAGFPIYQLTLEERATCPETCHHWTTCFGNGMPRARRHQHGPELIDFLRGELTDLQNDHPDGFVVRLHVLGDFYSLDYIAAWVGFVKQFPALHVFGYTAWPRGSEIGRAIKRITDKQWDRFAIRFSEKESKPQGAVTIWRVPEDDIIPEGHVCPAQTGKTDCCGTCGLCWSAAAKNKTIAFVAHGRTKADHVQRDKAGTAALKSGDSPPPVNTRAEMGEYLKNKQITVRVLAKGRFEVRGKSMDYEDLLDFANELRAEDGLAPFSLEGAL